MVPILSFSYMMHNVGSDRPQAVLDRLRAWHNLFAAVKSDLLVFDHSPTAMLAARGLKTRRVIFGTGLHIPPDVSPWPPFDPADADADPGAAEKRSRKRDIPLSSTSAGMGMRWPGNIRAPR